MCGPKQIESGPAPQLDFGDGSNPYPTTAPPSIAGKSGTPRVAGAAEGAGEGALAGIAGGPLGIGIGALVGALQGLLRSGRTRAPISAGPPPPLNFGERPSPYPSTAAPTLQPKQPSALPGVIASAAAPAITGAVNKKVQAGKQANDQKDLYARLVAMLNPQMGNAAPEGPEG